LNSSRADSSLLSRNNEPCEPYFPTDEDNAVENSETRGNISEPADEETPVWLVGNTCSIADLSFLTWANVVDRIGIDLETEFPVSAHIRHESDLNRKCKDGWIT
jgi:glutathione S-transferase